jgi:hypothetical protein
MADQRADEILEQMQTIRSALRKDAAAIVENAKLSVDWRNYVERYPWISLGIAAALGYLLVPRRRLRDSDVAQKVAREVQVAAQPSKEQSQGFLIGVALPFIAKAALQGGLSLVQSRMREHFDGRAGQVKEPEAQRRPTQPR